ncbi:AMP-dependent synthetase/ligase [Salsipaludibacter albus]|uniref:AMP-dependent synthetase/ligase n=1 Tax=Salsipaludibacter albus TaxID=2849650 RepID=UPI001EE47919|nr:long-chain fatty acid--CoA ligase [Salsipaludibacter albus]MBY5161675.1 long-chain fatty acid--CoA ligase [Salsipaludibacter albus]
MQEYTRPGEVVVDPSHNAATALFNHAITHPERPCLGHRVGDRFVHLSTRETVTEVVAIAKGLIAFGIEPGDRVAVLSPTRLEWTLIDYAIWAAGGVTVPIYETSSADQVQWVLEDSGARVVISADEELDARVGEIVDRTAVEARYIIDKGGLDELEASGGDVDDATVEERRTGRTGTDLATLVYTSGTTGRPKGCEITHGNFVWDVTQVLAVATYLQPGTSSLLFLPLAHILARVIQAATITAGVRLDFSTGIANLVEELGIAKPNFLLAVPRVFEKVYNGAQQRAHGDGKGRIFDRAAQVAIDYSKQLDDGGVGLSTRIQHAIFDRLVYSKLRAAVGGNVTHAISGGAALGDRLGHFFRGIGITIFEGYGLTETTAAACANDEQDFRVGTVGKPLPGSTIRIDTDGEILIKGGHVFQGYWNNEEATSEALDADGYFHTGDLGRLDDGFLRITGRKKEILVTAGGKNVAPAVLEDAIRSHHLVSQVMVVGDGEPFIAALVTLDVEALPAWCEANGKPTDVETLRDDDDLRAEIQSAVDNANRAVSKAESVRTFRILPEDFEVGRELSQKQSVKRHVVSEKYADVIDDIYAGTKTSGM